MPNIPKRSDERMGHRTKEELTVDKIEVGGLVRVPDPDPEWCPIALYAWEAYTSSPLNVYFTESDLAFGWMACHAVHEAYKTGAAMKIQAAESFMRNALFNEADRRRASIEITRQEPESNPAVDKNVADFRARRQARDTG